MNVTTIAASIGLILCALFLAWLLVSNIAGRIRLRKAQERDMEYRTSWSTWGDVTKLSA